MRRSISYLVATALVAGTALSFAPVQAAPMVPIAAAASDGIVKADYRRHDRHNNRHHDRHFSRRHNDSFQLFFGFPFAYILVLYALTLAAVSYVAPAREVSVLVGTALGVGVLREGDPRRRLMCAAAMVVGIVALAIG